MQVALSVFACVRPLGANVYLLERTVCVFFCALAVSENEIDVGPSVEPFKPFDSDPCSEANANCRAISCAYGIERFVILRKSILISTSLMMDKKKSRGLQVCVEFWM